VISLSATYATEELGLDQAVLTGAILMVQVVAIAGALGLGRLAGRYGAKRVVLGALVAWIGVLLAAFWLIGARPSQAPGSRERPVPNDTAATSHQTGVTRPSSGIGPR